MILGMSVHVSKLAEHKKQNCRKQHILYKYKEQWNITISVTADI